MVAYTTLRHAREVLGGHEGGQGAEGEGSGLHLDFWILGSTFESESDMPLVTCRETNESGVAL